MTVTVKDSNGDVIQVAVEDVDWEAKYLSAISQNIRDGGNKSRKIRDQGELIQELRRQVEQLKKRVKDLEPAGKQREKLIEDVESAAHTIHERNVEIRRLRREIALGQHSTINSIIGWLQGEQGRLPKPILFSEDEGS